MSAKSTGNFFDRLVQDKEENGIVSCTIVEKVGNTTFVVMDFKQRRFLVEGLSNYKVGQTVVVKNSTIIDFSKQIQKFQNVLV